MRCGATRAVASPPPRCTFIASRARARVTLARLNVWACARSHCALRGVYIYVFGCESECAMLQVGKLHADLVNANLMADTNKSEIKYLDHLHLHKSYTQFHLNNIHIILSTRDANTFRVIQCQSSVLNRPISLTKDYNITFSTSFRAHIPTRTLFLLFARAA